MTRVLRLILLVRAAPRLPQDEWEHVRRAVLARDNGQCQLRRWWGWGPRCGHRTTNMHVDHVVPKRWGGGDSLDNLRAACPPCNLAKGARPPAGWLMLRVARASAVYAALGWAAVRFVPPDTPRTPGSTWAVVAPGGQLVRVFDTREDAERARAVWDGGRGQLVVERSTAP